jgi:hypothetical protein
MFFARRDDFMPPAALVQKLTLSADCCELARSALYYYPPYSLRAATISCRRWVWRGHADLRQH